MKLHFEECLTLITWANDINWKVRDSKRRIYLMREHNWAFAAWEIEKMNGNLKNNSILVHVDSHLDDLPDGILIPDILNASSVDKVMRVSEAHDYSSGYSPETQMMRITDFIWPAIARGTIEEVFFVSRQNQEVLSLEELRESEDETNMLIASIIPDYIKYKYIRYMSTREFLDSYTTEEFKKNVGDRSAILDLDIDCFNLSDSASPNIMPLSQISEEVSSLMSLYHWDVITIAISPFYCGGNSEAEMILETVLKEMRFSIDQTEKW